jgi:tetratricopeptide (TPR) repeat protein
MDPWLIGTAVVACALAFPIVVHLRKAKQKRLAKCASFPRPWPLTGPEKQRVKKSRWIGAALVAGYLLAILLAVFYGRSWLIYFFLGIVALIFVWFGAFVLYVFWKSRFLRRVSPLVRSGEFSAAVDNLERWVRIHGPKAEAYEAMAVVHSRQDKWEDALRELEKAEAFGEHGPLFKRNKGFALLKLGRFDEALPLFEIAAQHLPNNFAVVCDYGSALASLGRVDEAQSALRQAEWILKYKKVWGAKLRQQRQSRVDRLRLEITERNDGSANLG